MQKQFFENVLVCFFEIERGGIRIEKFKKAQTNTIFNVSLILLLITHNEEDKDKEDEEDKEDGEDEKKKRIIIE